MTRHNVISVTFALPTGAARAQFHKPAAGSGGTSFASSREASIDASVWTLADVRGAGSTAEGSVAGGSSACAGWEGTTLLVAEIGTDAAEPPRRNSTSARSEAGGGAAVTVSAGVGPSDCARSRRLQRSLQKYWNPPSLMVTCQARSESTKLPHAGHWWPSRSEALAPVACNMAG